MLKPVDVCPDGYEAGVYCKRHFDLGIDYGNYGRFDETVDY